MNGAVLAPDGGRPPKALPTTCLLPASHSRGRDRILEAEGRGWAAEDLTCSLGPKTERPVRPVTRNVWALAGI